MPQPPPTIADIAAVGSLCFVVVSWGIGQIIAAFRTRGVDAATEAGTDASVAERLRGIEAWLKKVAEQSERSNDQFHAHEVDCAEFRGEMVTEVKSINKTLEEHGRAVGQMQSQIRLVVSGGSNRVIEIAADHS